MFPIGNGKFSYSRECSAAFQAVFLDTLFFVKTNVFASEDQPVIFRPGTEVPLIQTGGLAQVDIGIPVAVGAGPDLLAE